VNSHYEITVASPHSIAARDANGFHARRIVGRFEESFFGARVDRLMIAGIVIPNASRR
jgi:hypothetical protein